MSLTKIHPATRFMLAIYLQIPKRMNFGNYFPDVQATSGCVSEARQMDRSALLSLMVLFERLRLCQN
jgi:hypothetical protein